MKKILLAGINSILSSLLILGQTPLALAQEALVTVPLTATGLPRAVVLAQDIDAINKDIINHSRANRDEEIVIRQLIEENNLLTQALCERQYTVLQLRQELYGTGAGQEISNGCDSTSWLMKANRAMNSYSNDIVNRDRTRIAAQAALAPVRVDSSASSQDVMDLVKEVEAMKMTKSASTKVEAVAVPAPILVAPAIAEQKITNTSTLDLPLKQAENSLETKLSALEQKVRVIEEKNASLGEFKAEVSAINNDLKSANSSYDAMISEYSETIKRLKAQWAAEKDQQYVPLSNRNNELQEQVNKLQVVHAADQGLIKQLTEQNNRINKEVGLAQQAGLQSQELKNKIYEQNAQISVYQTTISDLTKSLEAKTEDVVRLTRQWYGKDGLLLELKNKLTASDARLTDLDSIVAAKDKEIGQLKKQLVETKTQLAKAKAELDAAKLQFSELRKRFADLNQSLINTRKDLTLAQQQLKDKGRVINLQKRAINLAQLNYDSIKLSVTQVDGNLDIKQEAFNRIQESVIALKVMVENQKSSLMDKDETIARLNDELTRVKSQRVLTNSLVEESAGIMVELRQQVQSLNDEFITRESDFSKIEVFVKDLREQIQGLNKQVADKDVIIKNHEAVIKNHEAILNNREATIKNQESIVKNHEGIVKEHKTLLKAQDEKIGQLKAGLQQITVIAADNQAQVKQVDAMADKLNKIAQQAQERQAKLRQVEEEKAQLAARLAVLESQAVMMATREEDMKALKEQLAAKEAELNSLRQQLQGKIDQAAQLSTMLDVYQQKVNDANGKYDEKLGEMIAAKKHQAQLEAQIAQLTEVIAAKDEQIKQGKDYFAELERRYSSKDQDIKAKDLSVSMLQALIEQKTKEHALQVEELHSQFKVQNEQLADLRQQLALADESLKEAPAKEAVVAMQADMQAVRRQVQSLTEQLKAKEELLVQVQAQVKSNEAASAAQVAQVEALKAQLSVAQDNLKKSAIEFDYKNKEVIRLKQVSKQKEAELKKVADEALSWREQEVVALTQKLNDAQGKLKAINQEDKVAQLKEALKDSQEQIKALKETLKEKNGNESQAMVDNKELKDALAEARKKLEDAQPRLESKDRQIQNLKADFAVKADDYQSNLKGLKEQVEIQKAQLAKLQQQLDKPVAVGADKDAIDLQLKLKKDAVAALEAELVGKTRSLVQGRKQIDELQAQLKQAYQQVDQLKVTLTTYESMYSSGPGNEGYLIRDGKSTMALMAQVNARIDVLQQELVQERQGHLDLESQYEAVKGELNEARALLQACLGKVLNQSKQPMSLKSFSFDPKSDNQ